MTNNIHASTGYYPAPIMWAGSFISNQLHSGFLFRSNQSALAPSLTQETEDFEFDYSFDDKVVTDPITGEWMDFTTDQFADFHELRYDGRREAYLGTSCATASMWSDNDLIEVDAPVVLSDIAFDMDEAKWIEFANYIKNNQ